MKIRCKFKDPETMQDAVTDAVSQLERPTGLSGYEWDSIRSSRSLEIQQDIADRWMEYGEYLDVEFDTEANTATILPKGSIE
jgi:hypothetical protein